MADDPREESKSVLFPNRTEWFDLTDNHLPEVFANVSHYVINDEDVVIYFGTAIATGEGNHVKPTAKLVLTHAGFLRMVTTWLTPYNALQALYDGMGFNVVTVKQLKPENFQKSIDILRGEDKADATNNKES